MLKETVLFLLFSSLVFSYNEKLNLSPLQKNTLLAQFEFENDAKYFPRLLREIMENRREVHVRFSQGRWKNEWGIPPENGKSVGGTGVEVWSWLEQSHNVSHADANWKDLTNSLAGLLCASLNFMDETRTCHPKNSFSPIGTYSDLHQLPFYHAALPREVVCTENLTPFIKLLPCKGHAGIASLLDGHKLFDSIWQSMSLQVWKENVNGKDELRLKQKIHAVVDIERALKIRQASVPIPSPNDLVCDEKRHYEPGIVCFPIDHSRDLTWSIRDIFGRGAKGTCLLTDGAHDICVSRHNKKEYTFISSGEMVESKSDGDMKTDCFKLDSREFDLGISGTEELTKVDVEPIPLQVSRSMTGFGAEKGGINAMFLNPTSENIDINYLESHPWYLRPYLHTMKAASLDGREIHFQSIHYVPSIDRKRGAMIELQLQIPANSTVLLTYKFEKAILKYTEYPPDANRGFDIAPAIVTYSAKGRSLQLRTTSLLLSLPTPDFSMPYNVIILTSTVVALAFGSIFNMLIRRFVGIEEVKLHSVSIREISRTISERIASLSRMS